MEHHREQVRRVISEYLAGLDDSLRRLNLDVHKNPELAYEEHYAHDTISAFLEHLDVPVTRNAYGLATCFEATGGSGGRCVNFNAELDALPDIGHACGHNLIATAGVAAFLALRHVIAQFAVQGRVQLLGTPAEEDGGGKITLLEAGAYDKADVSLMVHPMAESSFRDRGVIGAAGHKSIACGDLVCTYTGVAAHAGANPWEGVNALDAFVAAYMNISALRQQIQPQDRIHGTILQAPQITNAIPEKTVAKFSVRSPTVSSLAALSERVRHCLEAGALATGCQAAFEVTPAYADLCVNEPLCAEYCRSMQEQGERLLLQQEEVMTGSTDQGNVSYALPALHGIIGIPVPNGAQNHTREFCTASGELAAHEIMLKAAAAMAMTGWAFLTDDSFYARVSVAQMASAADVATREARKVRWKIDCVLLPLLGVCYMLQFLDKQTLSYASLLGILEDINLVDGQFSWTASIFYFGFIFWSYPTVYLSVRLPIGKYLSCTVIVWAAVLMCHAACRSFASLMVTRFFLGAFEAAIAPGFSLITGKWYTRKEQPLRYGLWFAGSAVASLFGGLAAYGIGHIEGPLVPWQYLILIFGGITAFWGAVMLALLPDSTKNALWLRKTERHIAAHRVLEPSQKVRGGGYKPYQVVEAFKDPTTWCLSLYSFSVNIANGGLTSFGSLVIQGFGYEGIQALLIQMPTGAAQLGFIVAGAVTCSYFRNMRTIVIFSFAIISLVGMVLMFALDENNRSGRLAGFCLSLAFSASMPISLSLVTSNVGGMTKKATVNACVLVMYCVGNIVGPQFFNVEDAPNYAKGIRASLAGFCLGAFFIAVLRVYLMWANARRDRQANSEESTVPDHEDKTDWEIPSFRYVL
ncbi:major facilitator superfamily domain-containing protein [Aspergillus recurvatus]